MSPRMISRPNVKCEVVNRAHVRRSNTKAILLHEKRNFTIFHDASHRYEEQGVPVVELLIVVGLGSGAHEGVFCRRSSVDP